MPTKEKEENGTAREVLISQHGHDGVSFKASVNHDPGGEATAYMLEEGEARQEEEREEEKQPREVLETIPEKRARRISHLVAYITTFVMSIGFSIILTGVWPYLQKLEPGVRKQSLGWVIAANPLGQMIASPLLGFWGNKAGSNRGAFLLTVFMFTLGNGLYAILSVFGSAAKAVMLFSRFLVGVSSANIAIIRSYIAASTRLKERTTAVALTSAAQGLGFIFGPAIQTALAVAFSKNASHSSSNSTTNELELEDEGPGIELNMYTATGWIGVVLGVINFILFMPCVFKEHKIAAKEAELQMRTNRDDSLKLPKPDYILLVNVLGSFFVFLMIYVLLETLLVPMCIDMYAWTDEMAVTVIGIGLSIAGAMSIVTFLLAGFLSNRFDERKVFILLGIVPMTLSMLLHFPMGNTYPKIKNCTTIQSIATTIPPTMDSLPVNITNGEIKLASTESEDYNSPEEEPTTREMLMDDDAATERVTTVSHLDAEGEVDRSAGNTTTLRRRRRRRHAVRHDTCNDVGCPPEQEWCFYTPIIERSQLIVATAVALFGYPIAFTLASSIFSKILGPKPQGVWMGILTSTGSFSRVTGPIMVSYMYTDLGTRWTFGILFFIMMSTLVSNLVFYKRIKPMQVIRGS